MTSKWRRYEVLLPTTFNDGREVPPDWLADALLEIVERFGAASYETQPIEGHWRHAGVTYRDTLVKLVVDVRDSKYNRVWLKAFRDRWKAKLEQIDIWLVSYRIDIE